MKDNLIQYIILISLLSSEIIRATMRNVKLQSVLRLRVFYILALGITFISGILYVKSTIDIITVLLFGVVAVLSIRNTHGMIAKAVVKETDKILESGGNIGDIQEFLYKNSKKLNLTMNEFIQSIPSLEIDKKKNILSSNEFSYTSMPYSADAFNKQYKRRKTMMYKIINTLLLREKELGYSMNTQEHSIILPIFKSGNTIYIEVLGTNIYGNTRRII